MKSAKKLLSLLLGFSLALSYITPALALQVQRLSVSLSDSRPTTSNTHTWAFTHTQSATLKSINFLYCKLPSGTCETPTNLTTTGATKGTVNGLTGADWSLAAATNGSPRFENQTANGEGIGAGATISIGLSTVTNNSIGGCNPTSNNSSDTCYVRLSTYTDVAGTAPNLVDEGIASYTVISAVQVQARVDPTFTFVVSAVASNTVHNGITTSVTSTYNTMPFGNLTSGTPKYGAHALNVTTNTENGYTVSMRMVTQMAGVYTANNIDPFAAPSATWSTPQDWLEPTGSTPNDNTGWIGANTTNNNVAGWTGADEAKFGPVSNSANIVMQEPRSDNGTTATFVTYAIEANVFQPADTYTGTLLYNALPTY